MGILGQYTKSDYSVCLSVYGKNLLELKRRLTMAHSLRPEFVEVRLDYLCKQDSSKIVEIGKLLRGNEILTFRSPSEGGVRNISEGARIAVLDEIISSLRPRYLDIEMTTLKQNPQLLTRLESTNAMLIASSHNFSETPSVSSLKGIIRSVPKSVSLYAVKVVCKARRFQDNYRVLSLYRYAGNLSLKIIAFCMGEYGLYSRIACTVLGSPFTYVSLPKEATAPGQLDITVMRTLLGGSSL